MPRVGWGSQWPCPLVLAEILNLGAIMSYGPGDVVVIPGSGVGVIVAVESIELDGEPVELNRIRLQSDESTVWIPVLAMEEKVRPLMSAENANETLEIIDRTEAPGARGAWQSRQRRYMGALMSRAPFDLALLLGELAAVRRGKKLSFNERKIFDRVKQLLIDEISAVLQVTPAVVEHRLTAASEPT